MSKIFGVHIPSDMKNHIKNGALDFWQEKETIVTTINTASTTSAYSADMIAYGSGGATVKNYSLQRSTDVPTITQSGFQSIYSNLFTMITGIISPATSDYLVPHQYRMEGLDYAKLHGKTCTFGFWTKASVAGTYSFALLNNTGTRSYVTTFACGSNTWEFKSITIPFDNAASGWNFDTTNSLYVDIGGYGGTSVQTSSVNQWQGAGVFVATGSTNWQATSGATLRVAQLSLLEGSLGLGPLGFKRQGQDISQELMLCYRYYEKSYDVGVTPGTAVSGLVGFSISNPGAGASGSYGIQFKASKRVAPTVVSYANNGTANSITSAGNTLSVSSYQNTIYVSNLAINNLGRSFESNFIADARL